MSGESENDLFVTGSFNQTQHFNGKDFYNYSELLGDGHFYDVTTFGDNVFIVGRVNQQPLFVHGVR